LAQFSWLFTGICARTCSKVVIGQNFRAGGEMEFLIVIGVVVAIVVVIQVFGQASLDKPIAEWSDDELVRRLPKYMSLLSAQMQSRDWEKTKVTNSKIDEIRAEIVRRQKAIEARQGAPLKRESLFSDKADVVVTEKAFAEADAGNVDMQVLVGSAYLSGSNGLPQDLHNSLHYLSKAGAQGHGFASFVVAGLYLEGMGVTSSIDQARTWAARSKSQGYKDADQMLAAIDAKRSAH